MEYTVVCDYDRSLVRKTHGPTDDLRGAVRQYVMMLENVLLEGAKADVTLFEDSGIPGTQANTPLFSLKPDGRKLPLLLQRRFTPKDQALLALEAPIETGSGLPVKFYGTELEYPPQLACMNCAAGVCQMASDEGSEAVYLCSLCAWPSRFTAAQATNRAAEVPVRGDGQRIFPLEKEHYPSGTPRITIASFVDDNTSFGLSVVSGGDRQGLSLVPYRGDTGKVDSAVKFSHQKTDDMQTVLGIARDSLADKRWAEFHDKRLLQVDTVPQWAPKPEVVTGPDQLGAVLTRFPISVYCLESGEAMSPRNSLSGPQYTMKDGVPVSVIGSNNKERPVSELVAVWVELPRDVYGDTGGEKFLAWTVEGFDQKAYLAKNKALMETPKPEPKKGSRKAKAKTETVEDERSVRVKSLLAWLFDKADEIPDDTRYTELDRYVRSRTERLEAGEEPEGNDDMFKVDVMEHLYDGADSERWKSCEESLSKGDSVGR